MGVETEIAWTDHTFNPWWGCTKISPGCANCYAMAFDRRVGGKHWGPAAPRRIFGEKHWAEPLKWNEAAKKSGKPGLTFCASMADVFEAAAPLTEREKLWPLIRATPYLRWQLLTKRPERVAAALPADWGDGYENVWLGTTVEDQHRADMRLPILRSLPARVRFVSVEPMLEAMDLRGRLDGVAWVIVGGESGGGARPMRDEWTDPILAACAEVGAAPFVKQMGSVWAREKHTKHPKGGDPMEWRPELRVRRFPHDASARIAA